MVLGEGGERSRQPEAGCGVSNSPPGGPLYGGNPREAILARSMDDERTRGDRQPISLGYPWGQLAVPAIAAAARMARLATANMIRRSIFPSFRCADRFALR